MSKNLLNSLKLTEEEIKYETKQHTKFRLDKESSKKLKKGKRGFAKRKVSR